MASVRAMHRHAARFCARVNHGRIPSTPALGRLGYGQTVLSTAARGASYASGCSFRSFGSSSSSQPPLDVILDLDETLIKARILGLKKNSRNFRVNREMRGKFCVIRHVFGRILSKIVIKIQNKTLAKFQIFALKSKFCVRI